MRIKTILLAAVVVAAPLHAESGPVTVYFKPDVDVVGSISTFCVSKNIMIVEQDDHHVVCQKVMTGLGAVFAQALVGNSYSTTPTQNIRFQISKLKAFTAVQASAWIETQMAFGQTRREALDSGKPRKQILGALTDMGGTLAPPAPPAAVPADPEPVSTPSPTASPSQ